MRQDPQRFVTFVLGSFILAFWMGLAVQIWRVWKRTGKCPVMAFRGGAWETWLHALGALVLWPGAVLAWAWAPTPVWGPLDNLAARLAGLMLLCVGASVGLFAALELGDAWRIGPDPELTPRFVNTGIYAQIRHPMYSAVGAAALGFALLAPTGFFLGWLLAIWSWINFQARHEERFLLGLFGDPYRAYLSRTRRFF
jgi:protein-S-isoprenylcysteine O-methyltransferase Ste14